MHCGIEEVSEQITADSSLKLETVLTLILINIRVRELCTPNKIKIYRSLKNAIE